jgi:hypothetical protein
MNVISEYVLATRPWSFTAAVVPVLVTVAVLGHSFLSESVLRVLAMAVAVQAGLVNFFSPGTVHVSILPFIHQP